MRPQHPDLPRASLPGWLCGTASSAPPPTSRLRPAGAGGGLRASPGRAAATRWGSGRWGRSPRGWAPPGPPPTARATATAAVTLAHTRARRWQHGVPKPLRSPLAEPRRYANEAAGAAHASLLRGDLGASGREAGPGRAGRGELPGPAGRPAAGPRLGREGAPLVLLGLGAKPAFARGQHRLPQAQFG